MKTILVLIDFSKKAERAALTAIEIARAAKSHVQLYTAFPAAQVYPSEVGLYPIYENYEEEEKIVDEKLKALANKLIKKLGKSDPPLVGWTSRPGSLAESIESLHPWLIVMGGKSKDGAFSHFMFGSNCEAVIDNASCPVLVIPEKAELKLIKNIAFATDLNPAEKDALSFVEDFGNLWDAAITVLHVSDPEATQESRDNHRYDFNAVISGRKYRDIHYADVRGKDVAQALASYSDYKAFDMIAVAHKKRSFFGQLVHKSISKTLLNYEHVPVLILNRT
ncbi:universal stress protein [Daejeonella sp.]|uniref:universal stress protein n=1 Tax=Daejeonella sp. TaxID=2805397 RepID=UPI0039833680